MSIQLTARQLEAVDIRKFGKDICVVAGPGSGKTSVLVAWFEALVAANVSPLRILAITFTEKAATNMKERLAGAFQKRPDLRPQIERAYVSTVHGFCTRLLRENAIAAGVDPQFRVLDERQAAALESQAVADSLDGFFREEPESVRDLLRALASPDLGKAVVEVYEAMRAGGMGVGDLETERQGPVETTDALLRAIRQVVIERVRGWSPSQMDCLHKIQEWGRQTLELPCSPASLNKHFEVLGRFNCNLNQLKRNNPTYDLLHRIKKVLLPAAKCALITQLYAPQRETLLSALRRFDQLYRRRKEEIGALDYSDLEEFAVRLLTENPDVRNRIRSHFEQVLMDEFQDTNGQQSKLLDLLRPPDRFYAVGDINQSIYGFRHADPEVFQNYRERVRSEGKHIVQLWENWRSRADILRAVDTILKGAEGIEQHEFIAAKEFPAKLEPSVEVVAALAEDIDEALLLEAKWVASRVRELEGKLSVKNRSARFGDMVVLVRNSNVIEPFTAAFEEFQVPYLVSGGKGFFETREVKDLTHLLRILVNPRDEISMAAVLRSPLVGVSDEALLRLKAWGNLGGALSQLPYRDTSGFDGRDLEQLHRFHDGFKQWREDRDYVSADRLLLRAVDETGYRCESGSRGWSNIEKFAALARESSSRRSLGEFVDELEVLRASDPRDLDAMPEESADAVRIMTAHAAKGLEFPVVFLAGMHKGMNQDLGDLSFSPRVGLGACWRDPVSGEPEDDSLQSRIREERESKEKCESDRLLYVAMTRAEEHLVLSFSSKGIKPQNWAAKLKAGLSLDLHTPTNFPRIEEVSAPDGALFAVRVLCADAAPEKPGSLALVESEEGVAFLEPPILTGQYDSTASVTSVTLFAKCPRRYYLARYLGWEGAKPAGLAAGDDDTLDQALEPDIDSGEFGRQVHGILAGNSSEPVHPEALRLAQVFQESELGRRALRASRAEREFDFLLALEDVVLRGQIDLWFEENNELIVVDYKTGAMDGTNEQIPSYALQVRLYALALERVTGRLPDKAFLHFLRPDVTVPVDLAPGLLAQAQETVREFRDAQASLRFPLREGEHCRVCPFFHGLCPAGTTESTSGVRDIIHSPAVHG